MHGLWAQFIKLAVAHLLAAASPGPDFALVVRQSLAHGRRAGIWTSLGIGTAILVHVTYAILGIGLLLRTYPVAFMAVKFAGAGYLAWIGTTALIGGKAPSAQGGAAPKEPRRRSAWTSGFLTNAFNPKVTLFFVAIFAAIVDPSTPRLIQSAYGLWMSLATMAWFILVTVFLTREPLRSAFLRCGQWIDRTMGVVLIGLAAALAFASAG